MDFAIRIANTNIVIHSVYSNIYEICKDYLISEIVKPDIEIRTDEDSIDDEFKQIRQAGEEIYSYGAAESLLVHRKIVESMLDHDTLLMHGAVIALDHNSYMFSGRSGTGKTTHIRKWIENAQGSFVLNGDKPMVIINGKGAFACGTPWRGKENYGTKDIVPLRSIVFMERSNENQITRVTFKSALPVLLENVYKPQDADKMKKALQLIFKLRDHVTFYKFYFDNYKENAFQTSFNALTDKTRYYT